MAENTERKDVSKLSKAEKRELAIKMIDKALEQKHCFISVMSSEDGTHCQSEMIGNGNGGVLAHCLVEVIKSDDRLKRDVMNNLTHMMLGEMLEDIKEQEPCDDPECKGCHPQEAETPEQNSPSTDNVH